MKKVYLSVLLVSLLALPSQAGDDAGIYGPDVPADAAFVRVIDLSGQPNITVSIGGIAASTGPAGVTEYAAISAGEIRVSSGDNQEAVTVEAGRVYSIALASDPAKAPTVHIDQIEDAPSKATIAIYNLSTAPVHVAALADRVPVLDSTPPGGAATRAVNAVVIDLYVETVDATIQQFPQFALQAQTIASFFVFGDGPTLRVSSTIERTRH